MFAKLVLSQLFREKLPYISDEAHATMLKILMGLHGRTCCWFKCEKRGRQADRYGYSYFLFLCAETPSTLTSNQKLSLPTIPCDLVAYSFTLLRGKFCGNSCTQRGNSLHYFGRPIRLLQNTISIVFIITAVIFNIIC